MAKLTAIILTLNEQAHIIDCLKSLDFADQTLVFDSFSTDKTVELAKQHGADIIQHKFEHYAAQRNAALDAVRHNNAVRHKTEWVLFVDADERVSPELAEEILQAIENPHYEAWRIPRHNYIFGKLTRATGWYPDYQTRLLRVDAVHYDPNRKVHELVILKSGNDALGTIKSPFIHYNYRDMAHFLATQEKYTAYEAQIMHEEGIHPKPQNYVLQPLRHFYWRFITLKGYQDGLHGLRLSLLMAWYELKKYWMLRKLWGKN